VRELRPRVRRIWDEDEDGVAAIVNRLLRDSNALPQLVRHDGAPYHLHATSHDAPLATRMAVEAAMAFVDVVRSGELSRLRICDYPGCGNVLVDLSKNRTVPHAPLATYGPHCRHRTQPRSASSSRLCSARGFMTGSSPAPGGKKAESLRRS